MTLIIDTSNEYKALFEELAKALGATIRVEDTDSLDTDAELSVLERVERGFKQAKAEERGEIKLNTLGDFLKTI